MNDRLREIARRYANRDRWTPGRVVFERMVRLSPNNAEAYAHLAFFVVKEGRYDTERGLTLLDRALTLDPQCAIAWVYRAMILGTLLAAEDAHTALETARRMSSACEGRQRALLEVDILRTRAWIDLDLWRLDDAIAGFERLVELCPESSSCILLATAYIQAGRFEEGLRAAHAALSREPDDFRGFAYAGVALLRLRRLDDARACLASAIALNPRSPLCHHTLAVASLGEGEVLAAEAHLRASLRADRRYVTSRKLLADLCAQSGRTAEARRHYRQAVAAFPGYTDAKAALEALEGTTSSGGDRRPSRAGKGRFASATSA